MVSLSRLETTSGILIHFDPADKHMRPMATVWAVETAPEISPYQPGDGVGRRTSREGLLVQLRDGGSDGDNGIDGVTQKEGKQCL